MPEGPNIMLVKERLKPFLHQRVTSASGYAKNVDPDLLKGNTLKNIRTWGKHLLLVFPGFTVRVHMGLFGSYRINRPVKKNASLHLQFGYDEVNFSIAKIKVICGPLNKVYDWTADIMSKKWDSEKAIEKLKKKPERIICDALLDQEIFSGSGNIIKNESLFRARIHPESLCGEIPAHKLAELMKEVVKFSADFLKWNRKGTVAKHLQAYEKEICPRNHIPFHHAQTGKSKRNSFYCDKCQILYG